MGRTLRRLKVVILVTTRNGLNMHRSWVCGLLAVVAGLTMTGCAGSSKSVAGVSDEVGAPWRGPLAHGHGAGAADMAPGCGPGFDVIPTGGSYDASGTLVRASTGQAVTITVTIRVQRTTTIRSLQLIADRPGTTSGTGTDTGNQAAVVDLYSGPAEAGQRFNATMTFDAPGRYPVEAVATSVSPGLCGGIEARDTDSMESAQPIGFIDVH